jgi:NTP pyrophosphatase (non-canonical NTP hydrolase)
MTAQLEHPAAAGPTEDTDLRVVLCGSFRRDPAGLRRVFDLLIERFTLLAPRAVDFVDQSADFVRLVDEEDESVRMIEQRHLDAISASDFVWLHAPDGYVGTSASMEIGHAQALGVPVFSDTVVEDEVLRGLVHVVGTPLDVQLDDVVADVVAPGNGISALQNYYARVAARRGWDAESPRDTVLLLTEELGELARAVRKTEGISRAGGYDNVNVAHEVADVQLYLVHLANALGVDLSRAVSEKERINAARAAEDVRRMSA